MKKFLVLIVMSFLASGIGITDYENNRNYYQDHDSGPYKRQFLELRDYSDIGNSYEYEDNEPIDTFDPDLDNYGDYYDD